MKIKILILFSLDRPIPLISYCSWCFILAKQVSISFNSIFYFILLIFNLCNNLHFSNSLSVMFMNAKIVTKKQQSARHVIQKKKQVYLFYYCNEYFLIIYILKGMTRGEDKECFKCSKKITDWSNSALNIRFYYLLIIRCLFFIFENYYMLQNLPKQDGVHGVLNPLDIYQNRMVECWVIIIYNILHYNIYIYIYWY